MFEKNCPPPYFRTPSHRKLWPLLYRNAFVARVVCEVDNLGSVYYLSLPPLCISLGGGHRKFQPIIGIVFEIFYPKKGKILRKCLGNIYYFSAYISWYIFEKYNPDEYTKWYKNSVCYSIVSESTIINFKVQKLNSFQNALYKLKSSQ